MERIRVLQLQFRYDYKHIMVEPKEKYIYNTQMEIQSLVAGRADYLWICSELYIACCAVTDRNVNMLPSVAITDGDTRLDIVPGRAVIVANTSKNMNRNNSMTKKQIEAIKGSMRDYEVVPKIGRSVIIPIINVVELERRLNGKVR